MQRSGDDERTFIKILLFLLLLFYEPLTTLLPRLPLLVGLAPWQLYRPQEMITPFVWLVYGYLVEIDHGLPFLSIIATIFLTRFTIVFISRYIGCDFCIKVLCVALFYIFFYAMAHFFNFIFHSDITFSPLTLLYYAILDLFIAVIL